MNFFDRAKKVIGNKNTYNEFLKVCNLFSQDLIDRTALVHRAKIFFAGSPETQEWLQKWIGYDERDVIVENKVRIPGGRVSLSNCRGLGPSYRLLPKRVSTFLSFVPLCHITAHLEILTCDSSTMEEAAFGSGCQWSFRFVWRTINMVFKACQPLLS